MIDSPSKGEAMTDAEQFAHCLEKVNEAPNILKELEEANEHLGPGIQFVSMLPMKEPGQLREQVAEAEIELREARRLLEHAIVVMKARFGLA